MTSSRPFVFKAFLKIFSKKLEKSTAMNNIGIISIRISALNRIFINISFLIPLHYSSSKIFDRRDYGINVVRLCQSIENNFGDMFLIEESNESLIY